MLLECDALDKIAKEEVPLALEIYDIEEDNKLVYDLECSLSRNCIFFMSRFSYLSQRSRYKVEIKSCRLSVYEYDKDSCKCRLLEQDKLFSLQDSLFDLRQLSGGIVLIDSLETFASVCKSLPYMPDLFYFVACTPKTYYESVSLYDYYLPDFHVITDMDGQRNRYRKSFFRARPGCGVCTPKQAEEFWKDPITVDDSMYNHFRELLTYFAEYFTGRKNLALHQVLVFWWNFRKLARFDAKLVEDYNDKGDLDYTCYYTNRYCNPDTVMIFDRRCRYLTHNEEALHLFYEYNECLTKLFKTWGVNMWFDIDSIPRSSRRNSLTFDEFKLSLDYARFDKLWKDKSQVLTEVVPDESVSDRLITFTQNGIVCGVYNYSYKKAKMIYLYRGTVCKDYLFVRYCMGKNYRIELGTMVFRVPDKLERRLTVIESQKFPKLNQEAVYLASSIKTIALREKMNELLD